MAVDRNAFIAVFPEFADEANFPEAAVSFWLTQADGIFPVGRYGAQTDLVVMLYAAHNLMLGKPVGADGSTAASFAPVASKSVGPVSKSYDTGAVNSADAGIYNGTGYGQRLWALLRGFATGGFYRPSPKAAAINRVRSGYYGW